MEIRPYPNQPNSAFDKGKRNKSGEVVYEEVEVPIGQWVFTFDSEGVKWKNTADKSKIASQPLQAYIPSDEIKSIIRLGQILKRPILIKGEPGSGKTQLAKAIAYEWYGKDYEKHFFSWHIKSNSKALDGIYSFDYIARLRDAQIPNQVQKNIKDYRTFGPLAKALLTSKPGSPSILLIDEIDKADTNFANDLLLELDEKRFVVPETEEEFIVSKGASPLIIITSNDEKSLSEAFLRRCLFMYIKFPDKKQLLQIIEARLDKLMSNHFDFVDKAIDRFMVLRDSQKNDPNDTKRVSTSELLDWLTAYDFEQPPNASDSLKGLNLYFQALLKTMEALNREEKL